MPKRSKIKWRQIDESNLTNLVRQFNAKVGRLVKSNPDLSEALPKRLTKAEFKENIRTRQDYNREVNKYKRFLRKGAENIKEFKQGVKITEWEKKELDIMARTVSNARRRELERVESVPLYDQGQPTGLTRGPRRFTQQERELQPKKIDLNKVSPGREFEMFREVLEKQARPDYFDARKEDYKQNYIDALDRAFGGRAANLIRMLEDTDAELIYDAGLSDSDLHIDYIYDPHDEDTKFSFLNGVWPKYIESANEWS